MATTNFRSVDEYVASRPEEHRPVLERVRAALRKALPASEEVISYQIPAYKVSGSAAVYFAGWKDHYSFYPASDALLAELREELAGHEVDKHTIRFSFEKRVPVGLLGKLAKYRAREVEELKREKAAVRKARKKA